MTNWNILEGNSSASFKLYCLIAYVKGLRKPVRIADLRTKLRIRDLPKTKEDY